MARKTTKRTVQDAISYLEAQFAKANFPAQFCLRVSSMTIERAHRTGDPNSFEYVYALMKEKWAWQFEVIKRQAPHLLGLPPLAHTPRPEPVRVVDGRTGPQWTQSAIGYLNWRAGLHWRSSSDRNHPERRRYVNAVHLLTAVSNDNYDPQSYWRDLPIRPPKKRPVPAHLFSQQLHKEVPLQQAVPKETFQPVVDAVLAANMSYDDATKIFQQTLVESAIKATVSDEHPNGNRRRASQKLQISYTWINQIAWGKTAKRKKKETAA